MHGPADALGRAMDITEPRLGQRVLDRRAATGLSLSTAAETSPVGRTSLARQADPDYPQTLTYPTETFASDAELRIAGLTPRTADFGPGESATATVYFEPSSRALFGGDLTGNHVTPALIEADSCGWLINLAALSGRFGDADTVYLGHGEPSARDQPPMPELQNVTDIYAQTHVRARKCEWIAPKTSPISVRSRAPKSLSRIGLAARG